MLMRLCKLSRLWFNAAGDTIRICKLSFHLDIGSTGSIKDETAVLISDLATIWSARACCIPQAHERIVHQ